MCDNWQKNFKAWPDNNKFTDFQFIVGPEKIVFHAHKMIFAASSPEFENVFYLLESNLKEIELPDTSPEIFKDFINFIYTGQITITAGNVGNLLKLSTMYLISILTEKCKQFLEENVDKKNVLKFLDLSSIYELPVLESKCLKIIEQGSSNIIYGLDFIKITRSSLEKIIELESLPCKEIQLFHAIDEWAEIKCDMQNLEITSDNKRAVLGDIILKICYGEMSLNEFGKCASENSPLRSNEIIKILQALAYPFRSSPSDFKLRKRKVPETVTGPSICKKN